MAEPIHQSIRREKLTRAGHFLTGLLEQRGLPVITPSQLFWQVYETYQLGKNERLYLRNEHPLKPQYDRLRRNLIAAHIIRPDKDYGDRAYYINAIPNLPADEITCILDPLCHVSHLSAMQRWGLTDRAPAFLQLTKPNRGLARIKLQEKTTQQLHNTQYDSPPIPLTDISHPKKVRSQPINIFATASPGALIKIRGTETRISSIEQTFLDTIAKPKMCGGMSHVIQVWKNNFEKYSTTIIMEPVSQKLALDT